MANAIKLQIKLGERSYDIHISYGLLDKAGELIASVCKGKKAAIVTNPKVGSLYAGRLADSLNVAGVESHIITIPAGERYKNLNTVQRVYNRLLDCRIDRTGMVIGLGGGVIGDLAGFVAATYLRGVDFVQVPTSLLAQVDASVGGKVGVDLPRGKNLVGAFYQPKIVIIDTATLSTLPQRELRTGLAEIIKHGIILDSSYFSFVEAELPMIKRLEPESIMRAVAGSCQIKARVVEQDERESGLRAILNFGHTVGHALEAITGYKTYRHGEAVAIGMVTATIISAKMGLIDKQVVDAISKVIQKAGLPLKPRDEISSSNLLEVMKLDKKVIQERLRFVLIKGIGSAFVSDEVTPKVLMDALEEQKRLSAKGSSLGKNEQS